MHNNKLTSLIIFLSLSTREGASGFTFEARRGIS